VLQARGELEQAQWPQESWAIEEEILPPRLGHDPRHRRDSFFVVSITRQNKPVILYVNQGNGAVNGSNFVGLLETASAHGFNTIFFQVYRSGTLLFTDGSLSQLVASAHGKSLQIFFALYFTNSTQKIPASIYSDGEDGINLDMSTLPIDAQTSLFDSLSSAYSGQTAITTTNPNLPLNPKMLVVETYGAWNGQYIHHGIIASVGVFATSSRQTTTGSSNTRLATATA
jgi:hypothetical protein